MRFTHLVAYRDRRVREAGVPRHADDDADRFGEVVSDSVGDLGDHDGEADREQEDPEQTAALLAVLVGGRAEAGNVHLWD